MKFSIKTMTASLAPVVMNRALLAALIAAPMALIWWSVGARLPLIDKTRIEIKRIYELEAEISRASASWPEKDAQRVKSEWRAVKNNIPAGYEDLAALMESFGGRAAAAGFGVSYQIGDLVKPEDNVAGLSLAPVAIKLTASYDSRGAASGEMAYFPFLDMLRDLADRRMWVDLMGVSLKGDGGGLREMAISINIWAGFEDTSSRGADEEETAAALPAGELEARG